jgi:hypothetical protein
MAVLQSHYIQVHVYSILHGFVSLHLNDVIPQMTRKNLASRKPVFEHYGKNVLHINSIRLSLPGYW